MIIIIIVPWHDPVAGNSVGKQPKWHPNVGLERRRATPQAAAFIDAVVIKMCAPRLQVSTSNPWLLWTLVNKFCKRTNRALPCPYCTDQHSSTVQLGLINANHTALRAVRGCTFQFPCANLQTGCCSGVWSTGHVRVLVGCGEDWARLTWPSQREIKRIRWFDALQNSTFSVHQIEEILTEMIE